MGDCPVAAIAVAGGSGTSRLGDKPHLTKPRCAGRSASDGAGTPRGPDCESRRLDLPPLAQTDPIVSELVARLSSHPTIAAWLATNGLITNFTTVTLNIAEGRAPQFLRPIAPQGRFGTTSPGEELLVDPRSYERYNPHGDAIAALDSVGTASLYLTLKPRITMRTGSSGIRRAISIACSNARSACCCRRRHSTRRPR